MQSDLDRLKMEELVLKNLAANVFDISFWSTLSSEIGLQLEINRLSLFCFSISLIMACLWDALRAFKHFYSLKEFMKIFLISFQKVQ